MPSLYKIYVYCNSLDIYIIKHGMCDNLMRPESMVRAAINAAQFICDKCNVKLSLTKSKIGIKQVMNLSGSTCRKLEKLLINNRQLTIDDFPKDNRLFDWLTEDCEISVRNANNIVQHACKLLDNYNSEFFIANENEKNVIDKFDDNIFNSYYNSETYDNISISEYFNSMSN